MKTKKITKAVIPAAGFGTRFLPQTKAMPKQMMPIVDKPIIQYVVEELVAVGIEDIIIVTNYHERAIEDHFDSPHQDLIENLKLGGEKKKHYIQMMEDISNLANFIYVRQKGPYGNGTPLLNARHIVGDEPFIYAFSDEFVSASPVLRFQQLIDTYNQYGCLILGAVRKNKDKDFDQYGYAAGNEVAPGLIDVSTIIEKPGKQNAPSDLAIVSGFVFTPEIFQYIDQALKDMNGKNELYWNDMLILMLQDNKRILAKEIENGIYYDTGNKLEYLKTVVEYAIKHPELGPSFRDYLKTLRLD